MANEKIRIIEVVPGSSHPTGPRNELVRALFLFPISPRIQTVDEVDVLVQDPAEIPAEWADLGVMPGNDPARTEIGTGDVGYLVDEYQRRPGESTTQTRDALQERYPRKVAAQLALWRRQYEFTNTRFDP